MIKSCLTYVFVLTAAFSFSQNLVPNSSFENHTSCPMNGSEIYFAIPWFAPLVNSTDLLDSCSTNPFFNVPSQVYNYQEAHFGNAMIGLFVFNGIGANEREYAEVQLMSSLISSKCYFVELFVNRAHAFYGGKFGVNNMACSFTSGALTNTGNGNLLDVQSHVMKFGNPIISDSINWIPIQGIYSANGGENYLTIGNFHFDNQTDTVNLMDGTYPGAYYFIDDVSVIPTDSLPGGMPAFAGNDTTIYYGDTLFIGQELYGLNCNWYDEFNNQIATNISGIDVWPDSSTYYVVEQILCSNTTYDTIWVTVDTSNIGLNNWQQELAVNLYPNPSSGQVFVEVASEINALNISVLDLNGREVFSTNLYSENGVFEVQPELSRGVYLIKITEPESGTVTTKRLVMQ